jgi:hydrogenase expression/formation protein HypC
MCLAVPGQIISIVDPPPDEPNGFLFRSGKVSFGGILREVNLAYVPEAIVGDYAIVHVGFALSIVSAAEAERTLEDLSQLKG